MASSPIISFTTRPRSCSYLPDQSASLTYRVHASMEEPEYRELLERGWRRQGDHFFRPVCLACRACRPLRVDVQAFAASKSQRKAIARNLDVSVVLRPATVSAEHLELFNAYHAEMHLHRGWPVSRISEDQYLTAFLAGHYPFAYEMAYYRGDRLIGVGLVDLLSDGLSSIYFYHAPDWRPDSPGTFSALQEIELCRQTGRLWNYLGYWVAGCGSMTYKSSFRPHQLLEAFVDDEVSPNWVPA